jgi:division protein 1
MEFRDPYELLLYSKATSEATMSELFVQPILPDELQQTNEWIQDMTKQTELLPDPIMSDEEDDQEPITFYQGFRALHPKKSIIYKEREQTQLKELKAQASKKQLSINIENLTINESHDQLTELTQPSTTSKRSSRMPTSTRHQQISINNIAKVFTKLLNQRESLMLKSEDLEFKKQTSKHELNQVETFIQKFQSRKEQLMDGIKDLEIQEHELFEELEFLDQRIGDIGSQAIKVEKSILSKSSVQNIKYETNTCIAVLFINQTLRGHTDAVECLDFEFPHGRLVTGSADKTLRVWDLRTNTCSAVLEGHLGWVRACQMSNYTVISGSGDHTAKLWDLSRIDDDLNDDDDEILRNSYYGHTGGITCLQFKDNTLITGSVDKTLRQWDIETGVGVLILERDFEAKSPIYTEDEPNPLSESVFHAWDSPSKTKNVYHPKNSSLHVGGLHFWKHALAAGYGDGIIRLYDIRSGQCHRTLEGHKGAVTSVSFDDNTILSGSMDKTVKVLVI